MLLIHPRRLARLHGTAIRNRARSRRTGSRSLPEPSTISAASAPKALPDWGPSGRSIHRWLPQPNLGTASTIEIPTWPSGVAIR